MGRTFTTLCRSGRENKQIKAAKKLTDEINLSDNEDNENSKSPGGFRMSPKGHAKKRSGSIKKYKRQKSKNQGHAILANSFKMASENADILANVKNMDVPLTRFELTKTMSKAKAAIAYAYFSRPPQMNFVPDEEIIEKLIWAATKYRYAKDIPRVL